jgi:hypothetical protein
MPDDQGQGQVPDLPGETPEQTTPEAGQELDGEFDPQRALRTIRQLRAEAKAAKQSLREYEALKAERMTEQERLAQRAERLEAELRLAQQQHQDRELDWAIERAAAKAAVQDPEAARLLLRQGDYLEFDDEGKPTNMNAALKQLLKERPWLAAQQGAVAAPSIGNPATRAPQPGQRTYSRSEIADYDFYAKHRDDIVAAFREGRISDD